MINNTRFFDPEHPLAWDLRFIIPPQYLPAEKGEPPDDYIPWSPCMKLLKDDNGDDYNLLERRKFAIKFFKLLSAESIKAEVPLGWFKTDLRVDYVMDIISFDDESDVDSEISFMSGWTKTIYRKYHNQKVNEILQLQDSARIISIGTNPLLAERLIPLGYYFVDPDQYSMLFFRLLYISGFSRFYRLFYFKAFIDKTVLIISWVKIIYAYDYFDSDFTCPLKYFFRLKISRDICFEELFDIFKVTNTLDSEGWLFPLEFDRQNLLVVNEYERLKLIKVAMRKAQGNPISPSPDFAIYGEDEEALELEKSMEIDKPNNTKKINVRKIEDDFQKMLDDRRAKGLLDFDSCCEKEANDFRKDEILESKKKNK
jgi:hypothetical protein